MDTNQTAVPPQSRRARDATHVLGLDHGKPSMNAICQRTPSEHGVAHFCAPAAEWRPGVVHFRAERR